MRRLALLAVLAVATTLVSPGPVTATPVHAAAAKPRLVKTNFAFEATGYGTRVSGGAVPVESGATAAAFIGCTNNAGVDRTHYLANVDLGAIGKVEGVRTRVWTAKRGKSVSSNSHQKVAGVTLLDLGLFKLEVTALSAQAKAWWDGRRFRAQAQSEVLALALKLPNQKPIKLGLPTVKKPIEVPGLLRISLGAITERTSRTGAVAASNGLAIRVLPLNTVVKVGAARAAISKGVRDGIYKGFGAGLRASVLDPVVKVGRTPNRPMPCSGTGGKRVTNATAAINIPGVLKVEGVSGAVKARTKGRRASAYAVGKVAEVSLLGGRLKIDGVAARANVNRVGKKLRRSTTGTTTVKITLDGKPLELPRIGKIEIPGLLKIEESVVTRLRDGLEVIGLQVKLLDGSAATIDLGVARAQIGRGTR